MVRGAGIWWLKQAFLSRSPVLLLTLDTLCCVSSHVQTNADPSISTNTISNCGTGVLVGNEGKGTLFDNTVSDCADFGVHIEEGGKPILKENSLPANNKNLP
jgi:parallel beta-helix repeat protein